jgi:hypothetical protein
MAFLVPLFALLSLALGPWLSFGSLPGRALPPCWTTTQLPKLGVQCNINILFLYVTSQTSHPLLVLNETMHLFLSLLAMHLVPAGDLTTTCSELRAAGAYMISMNST